MKLAELARLLDEYRVLSAIHAAGHLYPGSSELCVSAIVFNNLIDSDCVIFKPVGVMFTEKAYHLTDAGRQRLAELEALEAEDTTP